MSFRKEKKIKLSKGEKELLKSNLIKLGMENIYPKRYTSSCYFDSKELICFHESEDGILPRRKIRIRWYNNFPRFFKEEKISSLEGRYKTSKTFNYKNFLNDYDLEIFSKYYGKLRPTLIVNYFREFYFYKGVRVTFDSNINYINLRSFSRKRSYDHACVMEIKSPINTSDDFLNKFFPFSETRFSKYCRGILSFSS